MKWMGYSGFLFYEFVENKIILKKINFDMIFQGCHHFDGNFSLFIKNQTCRGQPTVGGPLDGYANADQ